MVGVFVCVVVTVGVGVGTLHGSKVGVGVIVGVTVGVWVLVVVTVGSTEIDCAWVYSCTVQKITTAPRFHVYFVYLFI